MDNETDLPMKRDLSLDLLIGEDEPPPNKFHISDVRLVDLEKYQEDDNNEESSNPNAIIEEESIVESQIFESEIVESVLGSKVVADEDYSSEKREEQWDKTEALIQSNDEAAEEEYTLGKMPSIYSRIPTRFTIQSDLEEIDEEEEEEKSTTPVSENFQQPERSKMNLALTTAMLSTEDLLLRAKNKMTSRAASMFEQRLKTISSLTELFKERKMLTLKNRFLNDKCCEHLKKITKVNFFESTDGALPIYGNQAYYNVLEEFMDTKVHYDNTKPTLEMETQDLTDSYYILRARFEKIFADFMSRELEVSSESIDTETGKGITKQRLQSLVNKQQRKFDQLAKVRVNYLKLHNLLVSIQNSFRALNFMNEGHTLMEYEQLVIDRNTSMDKLDDREDELLKLRNECTRNISILNCMKQSSEAHAQDIINLAEELKNVTDMKNEARNMLAFQRSKKDSVRNEKWKIHSGTGVLNSPRLLRKMEVDSQNLALLKQKIDARRKDTGIVI